MRSATLWLMFGLLCLDLGQSKPQAQAGGPVLFEGARLIVGDGSVVENSAFLVENGHFARVGRRGEIGLPAGATRVNLTGKTVIPGLIDAHAHLGNQRYSDWTDAPENYTRANILDQLNRASFFGLSAIYSAGTDYGDLWYTLRDEILAGRYPTAARWIPAGPGLTSSDAVQKDKATQNAAAQSGSRPIRPVLYQGAYGVDTAADARRAVQELAAHGVKVPKAFIEGRPGRGGLAPMSPVAYEAFIDEAHKHGMRTLVHAHDLQDAKRLLRAGNDGFAHKIDWPGPDAEVLAMLKERGTKVYMQLTQPSPPGAEAARLANPDPLLRQTLRPEILKRLQENAAPKTMTPVEFDEARKTWDETLWLRRTWPSGSAEFEEARKGWEVVKEMTRKFLATGIRIGVGSDTNALQSDRLVGWGMHVEMEEMVQSGMTSAAVIIAGTKTNADFLNLDDLGTVQPGKTATFVVLDANPLTDIRNTRKIHAVYLRGAELDRADLASEWAKAMPAGR